MSLRSERRKRLAAIIKEVDSLVAQRTALADGFLLDVEVTEDMEQRLNRQEFPDFVFQKKWNRFQLLTQKIDELREMGAKMVELKINNRLSGGAYIAGIKAGLKVLILTMISFVAQAQKNTFVVSTSTPSEVKFNRAGESKEKFWGYLPNTFVVSKESSSMIKFLNAGEFNPKPNYRCPPNTYVVGDGKKIK